MFSHKVPLAICWQDTEQQAAEWQEGTTNALKHL